jgi:multicomponent K+:H+ antiporter subunit D
MHWIILPVVLPALLAPLIGFVMRHDITLARTASVAGTVAAAGHRAGADRLAADGTTHVYRLGDWPAPFGIVLVLDRLSALMVLLTSVLGADRADPCHRDGMGRAGAAFPRALPVPADGHLRRLPDGDIFNLFVFFEVLLIASYGLMIHSGGKDRMRAGLQYVVMNLAGRPCSCSRWARSMPPRAR